MSDSSFNERFNQIMKEKTQQAAQVPVVTEAVPADVSVQEDTPVVEEQFAASEMGVSDKEDHMEREVAAVVVEDMIPKESVAAEPPVQVSPQKNSRGKGKAPRRVLSDNKSDDKSDRVKYTRLDRDMVLYLRAMMPSARTDSDAVAACVGSVLGHEVEARLTDEQRALVDEFRLNSARRDPSAMFEELMKFNRQVLAVERHNERLLRELGLAVVFLLGDRLNYDIGISSTPSQVDFLWPQYDLLYRRLSSQVMQFKKDMDDVDGRELYEAKSNGRDIKP